MTDIIRARARLLRTSVLDFALFESLVHPAFQRNTIRVLAQLARAPACHVGGLEFESRTSCHSKYEVGELSLPTSYLFQALESRFGFNFGGYVSKSVSAWILAKLTLDLCFYSDDYVVYAACLPNP